MRHRAWFGIALFFVVVVVHGFLFSWSATWPQCIGGASVLVFPWLEGKASSGHHSDPDFLPDATFIASLISCGWIVFGAEVEAWFTSGDHPKTIEAFLLGVVVLWVPIRIARMLSHRRNPQNQ